MEYLKIGKAIDLKGGEKRLYRYLEILPGFLSWSTLMILFVFSYFKPVWVAFFIIAFDIYWLLLVLFLSLHLLMAYRRFKKNTKINWRVHCENLKENTIKPKRIFSWQEVYHLIILPTYNEDRVVVEKSIEAIAAENYPTKRIIMVLAVEERGGEKIKNNAYLIQKKYESRFKNFIVSIHPDNIVGELKGKGANQAWAAKQVREELIDKERLPYDKILVSVFDVDTVIHPGYFYALTYKFLTTENPYRVSYQPVPVYHNNIWEAPFFARVAASSNTFWQMMQQVRPEKLATYSSHSMTWKALADIDFWSTKMVSEDSRIFWHCFLYYQGDYRVEPMYFPVSMDVCMDKSFRKTAINLYRQQRRWGWGVENVPYLIFNAIKRWKNLPKRKVISRILVQIYGFHSWATNALIIAVVGWMPMILGGDRFNATVLSSNLPYITRTLMMVAMVGLVLSAVVSTMLLPPKPKKYGIGKRTMMFFQWLILPFSIIIFGSIPGLDAQTRLMLGKYMGFWVTPKGR